VSAPGSEAGLEILKRGGNAVDATVATAFALAVTHPAAGNIGGGGFMLIHPGSKSAAKGPSKPLVIDYRETAPAAATKTMFAEGRHQFGHKVVGVPGTVRGLAMAHREYGFLPWKELVLPAVRLAEGGFILDAENAKSLNDVLRGSAAFPELRRVYGKNNGDEYWQAGDRLVQKDLARTLRLIAQNGPDAFYTGVIAEQIVEEMKRGHGLITKADLAGYEARQRQPIRGVYRGYEVYGAPPPSSGGICLVEMLNMLETFDLRKQGRWSADTVHLMIECMRRAYRDRARHVGDPAFTKIPAQLIDKEYARRLAGTIDMKKATSSETLAGDIALAPEPDSTTHISVIDKDGMAVANTYTLEQSYGSRVVVRGAGFLLNNEMLDFNHRPGMTDRKGGIGTEANLIAPGKRMLSSQAPTILTRDGRVRLVTGSPGGRTIINTVLCVVVNVVDFEMEIQAAVDAPRVHHQWLPDLVRFEDKPELAALVKELSQRGHKFQAGRQGDAHSIWVDPKTEHYHGAADRRISGRAAGY
jgi:gamma-glutamyltranspeptidase / glutathione hydrolase